MHRLIYCLFLILASTGTRAQDLVPDDAASKVHFTIKNFGFNTGGDFTGLKGKIFFNPDFPNASKFDVSVDAATIDTDNTTRDTDLKNETYFHVEKYPEIRLLSTKIDKTNKTDEGYYYFTGLLVMKGTSKVITFPFEAKKVADGYIFSGEFTINRLDFNVGERSTVLAKYVTVSLQVKAKNE